MIDNTQGKSNRPVMGTSATTSAKNVSGAPERGTMVPKKHNKDTDPAAPGTKQNRLQVPGNMERLGAGYRVQGAMAPGIDPAAGTTQATGRIMQPATNRSRQTFFQAMAAVQA